jgi:hypothetical protein
MADSGKTPSNCRRAATIRAASSTSGTRGSGAFADISDRMVRTPSTCQTAPCGWHDSLPRTKLPTPCHLVLTTCRH